MIILNSLIFNMNDKSKTKCWDTKPKTSANN
jgi:hypothetical protein